MRGDRRNIGGFIIVCLVADPSRDRLLIVSEITIGLKHDDDNAVCSIYSSGRAMDWNLIVKSNDGFRVKKDWGPAYYCSLTAGYRWPVHSPQTILHGWSACRADLRCMYYGLRRSMAARPESPSYIRRQHERGVDNLVERQYRRDMTCLYGALNCSGDSIWGFFTTTEITV